MANAFRAIFANFKMIPSRKCAQIIFEIPVEDFDTAYQVLGGAPDPSTSKWFGIAPLMAPQPVSSQPRPAAAPKRDWRELSPVQQAAIRCDDATFVAFLREQREDDWIETRDAAECVRLICGVQSRSELESNQKARVIWHQLDNQYQAWKQVEHA